jgi:hypothetical protein
MVLASLTGHYEKRQTDPNAGVNAGFRSRHRFLKYGFHPIRLLKWLHAKPL